MAVDQIFTLTKVSQDIESNTSVIRILWETTQSGGSYNNNLNTASVVISVNDVEVDILYPTYKLTANTTVVVCDEEITVQHDDAGECSVKVVATMDTNISVGTIVHNKTLRLPMIPRASTLSGSNGTLGTAQKLVINRKSTSFKHRITYNCGDQAGYVNGSTNYLTGDSYTWTPPLVLAEENPTGTSVSVQLSLWTYTSDGSHVDTTTLTLSYAIPTSVIPTIDQITITDTTPHSATYGQLVQGLSKLKIQVDASKAYGSDFVSYTINANGVKYTKNPATTGVLKDSGELTVNATVKDKRGRTGTKSKTYWAMAYAPPNVSDLEVHRCNQDGTENDKGLFVKVTFSATITKLNGINTAAYKLKYYPTGQPNNATEVSFPELNNVYSVTDETFIFAADENLSYVAEVTATDSHDSDTRSTSASTGFTLVNYHPSGKSIGFGKAAEKENAAEFAVDIYDKNNDLLVGVQTLIDMFMPVGTMTLRYDHTDPGTLIPGTTWTRVSGAVLRGAAESIGIGTTGDLDATGAGGRTYVNVSVWRRTE